jgi:hypothetical protein
MKQKNKIARSIVANLAQNYRRARRRWRKHRHINETTEIMLSAEKDEAWNAYAISTHLLNELSAKDE